ncbi:MAG: SpoIIE family protein phosphatase [Acidobacteriota bacterium]
MHKTTTIRRSLVTHLALVVIGLGLAIVLMMALSTRQVVRTLSESLIQQTSRRTELKLRSFFEPVSHQVASLRSWGAKGELDFDRLRQIPHIFEQLLVEFPYCSAVYLADENDREIFLTRNGSEWRRREMGSDAEAGMATLTEWTIEDPTPRTSQTTIDYRASLRPWFEGAASLMNESVKTGSEDFVYWTDPYTFFSTGKPGISASAAFRDSDGVVHVFGMDVTVEEISRFTSTQKVLGRGGIFVVTEDYQVLGVPYQLQSSRNPGEIDQMILRRPEDLGAYAARDASNQLLGNKETWNQPVRIVTDGTPWWGQITPYDLSSSQRLLAGVTIPEEALLEGVQRQRFWVIGITLIVLALAVSRVLTLSGRYSHPIEMLVDRSHRIRNGDLEPGPPIHSRFAEVKQLAEAHEEMRLGLQTLMKLEGDLRIARDVQRRTFPEKLPELPGFDIAAWNQPADQTGGDSYDIIGLQDSPSGGNPIPTQERAERAVLMLADATGHGIGPALSVTQLRAMLRMAVRLNPGTSGIIEQINHQLWSDLPTERFITAWLGILDATEFSLTAFSAAQAPLLLYRAADDVCQTLGSNSVALGMFPAIKVEVPQPIAFQSGDIYAAISDGIFEASAPDGEEMGTDRVIEVIRQHRRASAADIIDHIRAATDVFTEGAPADDDRTIILIKRT